MHLLAFLNAHIHQVGAPTVLKISVLLLLIFNYRNAYVLIKKWSPSLLRPATWSSIPALKKARFQRYALSMANSCSSWSTSAKIPTMVFWHVVDTIMEDHLIKKCKGFQIILLHRPQFYLKAHDKIIHSDTTILLVLKIPFNVFHLTGQEDVPLCKIIYLMSVAMTDKIEQKKKTVFQF